MTQHIRRQRRSRLQTMGGMACLLAFTLLTTSWLPAWSSPHMAAAKLHRLIFDDEFNGTQLDSSTWVVLNRSGDASNAEQECYRRYNAREAGGVLTIISRVDTSCAGYGYTSGMVQWKSFNFTYGVIQIRAKEPSGQGLWPALWLLGANCQQPNIVTANNIGRCQWPTPGSDEIDILELKGQEPTQDYMTVHYGSRPNMDQHQGCTYDGPDLSRAYHVFSLVWQPHSLTWYVDGQARCHDSLGVPHTPMFLILNTAVGGSFVGSVDSSALPQFHSVDYVRVYQ